MPENATSSGTRADHGHAEHDFRLADLEARRRSAIRRTFARLDPVALGGALGAVGGSGLALVTLVLVLRGGETVGPNLGLLGWVFPGYEVSAAGVLFGLVYGFVACFGVGFLVAFFRNLALRFVLARALWESRRRRMRHMLDDVG